MIFCDRFARTQCLITYPVDIEDLANLMHGDSDHLRLEHYAGGHACFAAGILRNWPGRSLCMHVSKQVELGSMHGSAHGVRLPPGRRRHPRYEPFPQRQGGRRRARPRRPAPRRPFNPGLAGKVPAGRLYPILSVTC